MSQWRVSVVVKCICRASFERVYDPDTVRQTQVYTVSVSAVLSLVLCNAGVVGS